MTPLWSQFESLISPTVDTHPWGCHLPRIIFEKVKLIALEAYDELIGLDLEDLVVGGYLAKAPCGG